VSIVRPTPKLDVRHGERSARAARLDVVELDDAGGPAPPTIVRHKSTAATVTCPDSSFHGGDSGRATACAR